MNDQEISALFFITGTPDAATVEQQARLPQNEVDPVTLSEVLVGFDTLLAKAGPA